jgi:glutathione-regulated potassium-efflux system protein KefB
MERAVESSHFLSYALLFLATAVVAVALSKRFGLGAVLGYLAAGALLRPHLLDLTPDMRLASPFSELGVILLLFVIGLELSPQRLWLMRRAVFGIGLLQVMISALLLGGAMLIWGLSWPPALIVGLGLALSSTAIGLQTLAERKQLLLHTAGWPSPSSCFRMSLPSRSSPSSRCSAHDRHPRLAEPKRSPYSRPSA